MIITVGSDAIEIIENTFNNLERRIFKCKIKIKIVVLWYYYIIVDFPVYIEGPEMRHLERESESE